MKNKKWKRLMLDVGQVVGMVFVSYIVFNFVVQKIYVNGVSMTPTVYDSDYGFTNVLGLKISGVDRFDIVVIDCETLNENIIKRVIGLPGEKIEYRNDQLYVDGVAVAEDFFDQDFIEQSKKDAKVDLFTQDFYYVVPENEYFVLGDNRLNSLDSRKLGTFTMEEMIGKNGLTFFPFNHFDWIK